MNTLDLLILLGLVVGIVRGMTTGVVRQVAKLFGLVVAFFLSLQLMDAVGALATDSLGISPRIAPVVGFVLVYLVVQVAVFLLIHAVESLIGVLRIGAVNRALGGALGALKAALVLSLVFLVLGHLGVPERETQARSSFYDPIASVLPDAWSFVAERLPAVRSLSESFGQRVEAELPETTP